MKTQLVSACSLILFLTSTNIAAQTIPLEGYVFEDNNRGYLRSVKIKVLDKDSGLLLAEAKTNKDGVFTADIPIGKTLRVVAERKLFFSVEKLVSTVDKTESDKVYVKMQMERRPGYIFDVTIAEPRRGVTAEVGSNAIDSARIEVFNNTNGREELVLKKWPYPTFKFTFERGNHYTIMIRRQGYFNKRIEAYVDVEDCILCFDGLGTIEPGVMDVLTAGNQMGTFLANIELEPLKINTTYKIENIYYDYNKSDIRPDAAVELDNLVSILKDNPAITVELGSHTDARGTDSYNLALSERRARAAVDYILANSELDPSSLTAKGYGETKLVNSCRNGRKCSEEAHQENRRTELKITGIKAIDPLENKSLKEIILEEKLMKEIMEQEIIKIEASK